MLWGDDVERVEFEFWKLMLFLFGIDYWLCFGVLRVVLFCFFIWDNFYGCGFVVLGRGLCGEFLLCGGDGSLVGVV